MTSRAARSSLPPTTSFLGQPPLLKTCAVASPALVDGVHRVPILSRSHRPRHRPSIGTSSGSACRLRQRSPCSPSSLRVAASPPAIRAVLRRASVWSTDPDPDIWPIFTLPARHSCLNRDHPTSFRM